MTSTQPLEAILFDNDGTLVDTRDVILDSFHFATETVLGYRPPDEKLLSMVGLPLAKQMWEFTDDQAIHDELCRQYRARTDIMHDAMISAYPQVGETLSLLKQRGFRLAVVTSKLHRVALHGLAFLGLDHYFDLIIGADDCPETKPSPGPLLAAASELQLAPETCAYVGDSPFDMQASSAAHCYTIAATWGFFERSQLMPYHPDAICDAFADIASLAALGGAD